MGERTESNLRLAFVAEAKAHRRLLAFARKADDEDYPGIGTLFRAIAYAEGVHADAALRLLGEAVVRSTEENVEASMHNENEAAEEAYPALIRVAEEEGDKRAARVFAMARDADAAHGKLYKRATECMLEDRECVYSVCKICGYVVEGEPPDPCPICNAGPDKWERVA